MTPTIPPSGKDVMSEIHPDRSRGACGATPPPPPPIPTASPAAAAPSKVQTHHFRYHGDPAVSAAAFAGQPAFASISTADAATGAARGAPSGDHDGPPPRGAP